MDFFIDLLCCCERREKKVIASTNDWYVFLDGEPYSYKPFILEDI